MLETPSRRQMRASSDGHARLPRARPRQVASLADFMHDADLSTTEAVKHARHQRQTTTDKITAPTESHDSAEKELQATVQPVENEFDRGTLVVTRKLFDPKTDPPVGQQRKTSGRRPTKIKPADLSTSVATTGHSPRNGKKDEHMPTEARTNIAYQQWKNSVTLSDDRLTRVSSHQAEQADPPSTTSLSQPHCSSSPSTSATQATEHKITALMTKISKAQKATKKSSADLLGRRATCANQQMALQLKLTIDQHVELLELYHDLFELTQGNDKDSNRQGIAPLELWSTAIQPAMLMLERLSLLPALPDGLIREWTDYFFVQSYGLVTVLLAIAPAAESDWVQVLRMLASERCRQVSGDPKASLVWQAVVEYWQSQQYLDQAGHTS